MEPKTRSRSLFNTFEIMVKELPSDIAMSIFGNSLRYMGIRWVTMEIAFVVDVPIFKIVVFL